jgi:hypothetical protein
VVTVFACDFIATIGGVVIVLVGILVVHFELCLAYAPLLTGLETFDSVDTEVADVFSIFCIEDLATDVLGVVALEPLSSDFSTDVTEIEVAFELETGTGADFRA